MTEQQHRAVRRRGAPVPQAELEPPAHLNSAQRAMFIEARDSRPGYWTSADARLLSAWACASARATELESDPGLAVRPSEYSDVLTVMVRVARALRLSPNARTADAADDPVPTPEFDNGTHNSGPSTGSAPSPMPWIKAVA